jgi:hypothetical protein
VPVEAWWSPELGTPVARLVVVAAVAMRAGADGVPGGRRAGGARPRRARRAGGGGGAAVALAGAVLEVRPALVLDVAQELGCSGSARGAAAMASRRTTCSRPASARWSRSSRHPRSAAVERDGRLPGVLLAPDQLSGGGRVGDLDPAGAVERLADRGGGGALSYIPTSGGYSLPGLGVMLAFQRALALAIPWREVSRRPRGCDPPCSATAAPHARCRAPTRASGRNHRRQMQHGRFLRTAPTSIADRRVLAADHRGRRPAGGSRPAQWVISTSKPGSFLQASKAWR